MPIYFDLHPPGVVPLPAITQGLLAARTGAEDRHHVRQVDYYCADDGAIYCVLEAPSPDEFRARHAERGLPCEEVLPIADVDWQVPLGAAARRALNQAIQRDWQARLL